MVNQECCNSTQHCNGLVHAQGWLLLLVPSGSWLIFTKEIGCISYMDAEEVPFKEPPKFIVSFRRD